MANGQWWFYVNDIGLRMHFDVSLETLGEFADRFWKSVGDARVFAFHGAMGAGKTTIITAICRSRGVSGSITSPTFSLVNDYRFVEEGEEKTIFHIDLYRLQSEEEVVRAGVEDCITSGAYCLVEWPEKAPFLFDERTVHVYVEPLSETERRVEIVNSFAARGS